MLEHRGYTELITKHGVRPLNQCNYKQLYAVYMKGRVVKVKKEIQHEGAYNKMG